MKSKLKSIFLNEFSMAAYAWVALLLVAILVADKLVLPWLAGAHRQTVQIPNVVGLNPNDAEDLLDKLNLNLEIADSAQFSLNVPEGKLMSQVPMAGRKVKEGRTIFVIKSKGIKQIQMPNLEGRTKKDAELILAELGLGIKGIEDGSHTTLPRNSIIRTIPEAGAGIRTGDSVILVVCKNSQGVMVPPLEGKSLEEARDALDKANLILGDIKHKSAQDQQSETIIDQSPKAGERLKPQGTVSVTVAE